MLHEGLPKWRETDAKTAPFEQTYPQGFFEGLDALGQRRLRNFHRRRSFGEIAIASSRQEELNFSVIHNLW